MNAIDPMLLRCLIWFVSIALTTGCTRQNQPVDEKTPEARSLTQVGSGSETKSDLDRPYCEEHACYEDECFICHPEIRDKGRLWCKGHDRYEDRCFECHPELDDPNRVLCEKHFLFEDECFLCRPELKSSAEPSPGAAAPARLMCNEHGVFEDECGICHPELVATIAPGQSLKVRFASSEAAAKAGIQTENPRWLPLGAGVDCYAEIQFDQNKLAEIVAQVDGIIHAIEVDLGHQVEEGDVLATVHSAAIGEAVAKARLTKQTLDRERTLRAERITSERDLQEAEAAFQSAYETIRTLGFDEKQIDAIFENPAEQALLQLRAPFSGEIVERDAVRGALVESGKSLFTLADRTSVWAMLNIPEKRLADIRVGQKVELKVDALPTRTFSGALTWIAAQVDDRTRMARARVEVPNPDGSLRAQMFARARILTTGREPVLSVPQSAIQRIDGTPMVFVQLHDDLYEARRVLLGATLNGSVEVLEGIRAEDRVVTANTFIAKSQLLLSRLGAGCVDE